MPGTPAGTSAQAAASGAIMPSASGNPFSPTDIDVQSVTGNTAALMPGSVDSGGAAAAPASSGIGKWVVLALTAGAAFLSN
jgi:hypothetical protein